MIQYSLYFKTINNTQKYETETNALKHNLPSEGNVRTMMITEKQFLNMKILNGKMRINEKYNSNERYVKIDDSEL